MLLLVCIVWYARGFDLILQFQLGKLVRFLLDLLFRISGSFLDLFLIVESVCNFDVAQGIVLLSDGFVRVRTV